MTAPVACRAAFTQALLEMAQEDPDIIAITSDARGSVTLTEFAQKLPEQFIDVGIAEQNELSIAAGLATCGKKPFVCAPACFLSGRSLEQVKVDVAYTNTDVKIIGVSGGVSYGPLGASHHSLHDIAVMRAIPGINVILPCDAQQTRKMTLQLVKHKGPVYVRMGRNPISDIYTDNIPFTLGKANVILGGSDITIIAVGEMVRVALDAGIKLRKLGIAARLIDMYTLKPIDEDVIKKAAEETGCIITVEEHHIHGGLGSAVSDVVVQNFPVPIKIMGIPDEAVVTGNSEEVFQHYGLTADNIVSTAIAMISKKERKNL